VYSGGAARKFDDFAEEAPQTASAPDSEHSRYRPQYRVVTRKPLVAAPKPRGGRPHQRTVLLSLVPAVCLLVYVAFWVLAMRGGYYRDHLQAQINGMKLEQAELQAEKRRLQSPGTILQRADTELGMKAADRREFARVPSTPVKPAPAP
jgi:hypothetical protein